MKNPDVDDIVRIGDAGHFVEPRRILRTVPPDAGADFAEQMARLAANASQGTEHLTRREVRERQRAAEAERLAAAERLRIAEAAAESEAEANTRKRGHRGAHRGAPEPEVFREKYLSEIGAQGGELPDVPELAEALHDEPGDSALPPILLPAEEPAPLPAAEPILLPADEADSLPTVAAELETDSERGPETEVGPEAEVAPEPVLDVTPVPPLSTEPEPETTPEPTADHQASTFAEPDFDLPDFSRPEVTAATDLSAYARPRGGDELPDEDLSIPQVVYPSAPTPAADATDAALTPPTFPGFVNPAQSFDALVDPTSAPETPEVEFPTSPLLPDAHLHADQDALASTAFPVAPSASPEPYAMPAQSTQARPDTVEPLIPLDIAAPLNLVNPAPAAEFSANVSPAPMAPAPHAPAVDEQSGREHKKWSLFGRKHRDEATQAEDASAPQPDATAAPAEDPLAWVNAELIEGRREMLAQAESRSRENEETAAALAAEQPGTQAASAPGAEIDESLSPHERAEALAERMHLPFIDLSEFVVDESVLSLVPEQLCRRYSVIPLSRSGDTLMVAIADPSNVLVIDDISASARLSIAPVVAEPDAISSAIDRYYRLDTEIEELTSAFASATPISETLDQDVSDASSDEAPIIRFVNLLISQAISDRASDIHIEPRRGDLFVRYRIDGVLHEVQRVSRNMTAGVISRLKVMADMDIGERRKPQDGRISISHSGRTVDLRVATLPTVWGEKVVMRVLDAPVASLQLADLNMLDRNMQVYQKSFTKPYGMMLVTGPTGSGKSTTLYTTLASIARPEVNVITVEDPVEYRLDGVNQVQVNPKAGLTFASALRSILRSDPDIVLIGEIRDQETAQIAIESALTGHLVLSTLHTNDAPSAVTRLIEMGVEPFLVGSALDCVVAQRLARRLCPKCKRADHATEAELRMLGLPLGGELPEVFRPVGCPQCTNTGYKGRVALHEVMAVDDDIERLAVENAPVADLTAAAVRAGMSRLREDGWAKVQMGLTSIDEILRTTI